MSRSWTRSSLAPIVVLAGVSTARAATAQSSPPAASASAAAAAAALVDEADALNHNFYDYVFIVLSGLIVVMAVWRLSIELSKYVRTLTCLNDNRQAYFVKPSATFARFKKHILYAPVLGRRHNREFQLSAAVNVGTLPTRLQLLFILAYVGSNAAYCVVSIDWTQPTLVLSKELRNRTGILAVANLVGYQHIIPCMAHITNSVRSPNSSCHRGTTHSSTY